MTAVFRRSGAQGVTVYPQNTRFTLIIPNALKGSSSAAEIWDDLSEKEEPFDIFDIIVSV